MPCKPTYVLRRHLPLALVLLVSLFSLHVYLSSLYLMCVSSYQVRKSF